MGSGIVMIKIGMQEGILNTSVTKDKIKEIKWQS